MLKCLASASGSLLVTAEGLPKKFLERRSSLLESHSTGKIDCEFQSLRATLYSRESVKGHETMDVISAVQCLCLTVNKAALTASRKILSVPDMSILNEGVVAKKAISPNLSSS